ncbi:MAG: response regulator [Desulfobacula sp.]|jgi:two-component system, cell cycle response regulator DivK|nr:response regulator [Desulfobacula sp.]MBT6338365.1 response regulator [Desulfobacula sp.]MBT7261622.1 response regulator [Desulfobacula sp.]
MKNKVLIIEDNEQNMYLFTYLLEKNGYETLQANDGLTGIDLAKQQIPELILLDIQLPDMNGYQIAQQLRSNLKTNKIPIIAVTSYAMVGDKERTIEAGCTGYIEKPINPDTFMSEIERFLPNKKD